MLSRGPTAAKKTGRTSAVVLGVLLCISAYSTGAAGADSVDALAAGASLYGYFRETDPAAVLARRPATFTEIRHEADATVRVSFDGETVQAAIVTRLHNFGNELGLSSDPTIQGDSEVLLRNSEAVVRTKVRVTLGEKWLGFVYADMGAVDSSLRWQGLAGIRGRHGLDLLGGWRHVTYRFTPGMGFDSLVFNGPFLGATLAW